MNNTLVMLAAHEQFAMSLHLSVFHYYICDFCYGQTASAVES